MAVCKKGIFLATFAQTANITRAAMAVGIDRMMHYRWLRDDSEYAEDFKQATVAAAGLIEDKAVERAVEGWEEPVIYQGELVFRRDPETHVVLRDENLEPIPLMVRKHSDALLTTLLKAWLSKKYRDNHHVESDVTHHGLSSMTDAELERIAIGNAATSGGGTPPATTSAE
jgi:hypothetical protein